MDLIRIFFTYRNDFVSEARRVYRREVEQLLIDTAEESQLKLTIGTPEKPHETKDSAKKFINDNAEQARKEISRQFDAYLNTSKEKVINAQGKIIVIPDSDVRWDKTDGGNMYGTWYTDDTAIQNFTLAINAVELDAIDKIEKTEDSASQARLTILRETSKTLSELVGYTLYPVGGAAAGMPLKDQFSLDTTEIGGPKQKTTEELNREITKSLEEFLRQKGYGEPLQQNQLKALFKDIDDLNSLDWEGYNLIYSSVAGESENEVSYQETAIKSKLLEIYRNPDIARYIQKENLLNAGDTFRGIIKRWAEEIRFQHDGNVSDEDINKLIGSLEQEKEDLKRKIDNYVTKVKEKLDPQLAFINEGLGFLDAELRTLGVEDSEKQKISDVKDPLLTIPADKKTYTDIDRAVETGFITITIEAKTGDVAEVKVKVDNLDTKIREVLKANLEKLKILKEKVKSPSLSSQYAEIERKIGAVTLEEKSDNNKKPVEVAKAIIVLKTKLEAAEKRLSELEEKRKEFEKMYNYYNAVKQKIEAMGLGVDTEHSLIEPSVFNIDNIDSFETWKTKTVEKVKTIVTAAADKLKEKAQAKNYVEIVTKIETLKTEGIAVITADELIKESGISDVTTRVLDPLNAIAQEIKDKEAADAAAIAVSTGTGSAPGGATPAGGSGITVSPPDPHGGAALSGGLATASSQETQTSRPGKWAGSPFTGRRRVDSAVPSGTAPASGDLLPGTPPRISSQGDASPGANNFSRQGTRRPSSPSRRAPESSTLQSDPTVSQESLKEITEEKPATVNVTKHLNIRDERGNLKGSLNRGETVTIFTGMPKSLNINGTSYEFVKIKSDTKEGWVARKFLKEVNATVSTPSNSPTVTTSVTPDETSLDEEKFVDKNASEKAAVEKKAAAAAEPITLAPAADVSKTTTSGAAEKKSSLLDQLGYNSEKFEQFSKYEFPLYFKHYSWAIGEMLNTMSLDDFLKKPFETFRMDRGARKEFRKFYDYIFTPLRGLKPRSPDAGKLTVMEALFILEKEKIATVEAFRRDHEEGPATKAEEKVEGRARKTAGGVGDVIGGAGDAVGGTIKQLSHFRPREAAGSLVRGLGTMGKGAINIVGGATVNKAIGDNGYEELQEVRRERRGEFMKNLKAWPQFKQVKGSQWNQVEDIKVGDLESKLYGEVHNVLKQLADRVKAYKIDLEGPEVKKMKVKDFIDELIDLGVTVEKTN